ncbi:hypothetical protein C8J57DRAFT_1258771 [Mycena rebaudengoi]|nr:hypothetical protein C8J57DRAFT_1258771 [Mycena rebaudengoi]
MPRASDFVVLPSPFHPHIFPSSARPLTFRQASRWLGAVALAVFGAVAHVVPATMRCVDKGGLMELQLEAGAACTSGWEVYERNMEKITWLLNLNLNVITCGGCGMDLEFWSRELKFLSPLGEWY